MLIVDSMPMVKPMPMAEPMSIVELISIIDTISLMDHTLEVNLNLILDPLPMLYITIILVMQEVSL